jgi:antitoxin ParD1/3/4
MNVSLPAPLKEWVQRQVEERGFSTASEYVRDVLRRQREDAARAAVDVRLTDAINSGESTPMTRRDWDRIRAEGLKRARGRRKK